MDVATHHVSFPYLEITLRPTQCALTGRNATTKALRNIEHIYKSGFCVEFA